MSSRYSTDWKLFAEYIRGVRVSAFWSATWVMTGNQIRAYLNLRVVVWLIGVRLGLTAEAARLSEQSPQCQSQTIPCTITLQ